jgi:hypothetical protein
MEPTLDAAMAGCRTFDFCMDTAAGASKRE